MNQKLTRQESHNLAMNLVGEELEKDGYEFLAINSDLKKNPQFVVLKNKETFFVVVRHVSSSEQLNNYIHITTKPILEHAIKHNAKVYYVGVLLGHGLDINLPIINGRELFFCI